MNAVEYGRYEEAYRAIHSALSGIACAPPGKKITKWEFTWNADDLVEALRAYGGEELLFTLTFAWSATGNLQEIARS
ncbi:MAG: hypothetical protein NWF04_06205 [Candidatus Bathyarchaeota archaeon]|nr:hypothetical protein [Candidatus Bathyarchaeota archaeon]